MVEVVVIQQEADCVCAPACPSGEPTLPTPAAVANGGFGLPSANGTLNGSELPNSNGNGAHLNPEGQTWQSQTDQQGQQQPSPTLNGHLESSGEQANGQVQGNGYRAGNGQPQLNGHIQMKGYKAVDGQGRGKVNGFWPPGLEEMYGNMPTPDALQPNGQMKVNGHRINPLL